MLRDRIIANAFRSTRSPILLEEHEGGRFDKREVRCRTVWLSLLPALSEMLLGVNEMVLGLDTAFLRAMPKQGQGQEKTGMWWIGIPRQSKAFELRGFRTSDSVSFFRQCLEHARGSLAARNLRQDSRYDGIRVDSFGLGPEGWYDPMA